MGYLYITIATLLLAVMMVFTKLYEKRTGTGMHATILYNALCGLFTMIMFFIVGGFKVEFHPYSILMAGLMSLFVGIYSIIGFKLMAMGKVAIYTLFLMLGGMMLPFLYGIAFLGEEINPFRCIGLVLLVASMIISNTKSKTEKENEKENASAQNEVSDPSSKKSGKLYIFLCICVFVINGFVSIVCKLHQIETALPTVSEIDFVTLCGITKFVMFAVGFAVYSIKNKPTKETRELLFSKKNELPILFYTLMTALVVGVSTYLQLKCAIDIPASALYPMVTGGTIVFTSIASIICFKERLNKRETVGIALCMLSTLLFL